MNMLSETVDVVIGVDTHKHTHTAAVVQAATGAEVENDTMAANHTATSSWLRWLTVTRHFGCGRSREPVDMAPVSPGI